MTAVFLIIPLILMGWVWGGTNPIPRSWESQLMTAPTAPNLGKPLLSTQMGHAGHPEQCPKTKPPLPASQVVQGEAGWGATGPAEQTAPREGWKEGWELGQWRQRRWGLC